MEITKEQAIDILDKFDFFQGQRAGRELWNDKPYEVQEEDIKAFSRDVAELKAYIADVVPKSEVERLQGRIAELQIDLHYSVCREDEARQKVAREIFEEMDGITELFIKGLIGELEMYDQLAELKKKYTGEK